MWSTSLTWALPCSLLTSFLIFKDSLKLRKPHPYAQTYKSAVSSTMTFMMMTHFQGEPLHLNSFLLVITIGPRCRLQRGRRGHFTLNI